MSAERMERVKPITHPSQHHPRGRQILAVSALLASTAVWGATFLLVKITIARLDVYYFLFLRFAIAAIVLFAFCHRQILSVSGKTLKSSLILGVMISIMYISQTEGLKFTSAANSALITCLYMVLVPPFAFFYSGTSMEKNAWTGITVALAGMILLTYYGLRGPNLGDVITLTCAVAAAWHIILTGKYAHTREIIPLVFFQLLLVVAISGVVAAIKGSFTMDIAPFEIFTILFTSLFATVASFLVQVAAQKVISPTRAGVIFSMEAVFGSAFAWGFGMELPTLISFAGACLMVGGMLISELSPFKKLKAGSVVG